MADDEISGPAPTPRQPLDSNPPSQPEFGVQPMSRVSGIKPPNAEPIAMPPIALNPSAARSTAAAPKPNPPQTDLGPKDTFRELIETVVFVVVLVLMLKTFLAEAFVIPTGSMADTLLGYHFKVTCAQCGYPNLVNASWEADPQNRPKEYTMSCQCQNCGFTNVMRQAAPLEERR